MEKLVIIDTDAGIDDCWAILLAIAAHKSQIIPFKIMGIVCVNGNTSLANVCKNVTRILQVANVTDIPIFKGCAGPMVLPYNLQANHFGSDGFGDADLGPIEPKLQDENGVMALIRLIKLYKDKLTIFAIGPLTNLGMAVRLDPSIKDCVKEIFIMGGNIQGVGNASLCGEFNFLVDPESAYVSLSSFSCSITIIPLEACRRPAINLKDFRIETLNKLDTPEMTLMKKIETKWTKLPYWMPCDLLAAAVLVEPQVIEETKTVHATVELSGHFSRGLMVLDHTGKFERPKNVTTVNETNGDLLKKLTLWAAGGPYYK